MKVVTMDAEQKRMSHGKKTVGFCASYDRATSFSVPENGDSKKARLIPRLWRKRASLTSIIAILLTETLATTSEYVVGWRSAKIVSHRLDIRNWPSL